MDREEIRNQLDLAMEHVQRGAALVAEQRLLIERLQLQGQDLDDANKTLATLESIQAANITHRDMLYQRLMADAGV
jgi:hypothetical protein